MRCSDHTRCGTNTRRPACDQHVIGAKSAPHHWKKQMIVSLHARMTDCLFSSFNYHFVSKLCTSAASQSQIHLYLSLSLPQQTNKPTNQQTNDQTRPIMSASNAKKLVVVAGATGAQGGSVVEYLLKDGGYKVRGLTRNVESDKAKALAVKGVEVVKADLHDVESVTKALDGAWGFFLLTQFWEKLDYDDEVQQGKNAVAAAKAAGVEFVVASTLISSKELYDISVPHFDAKWVAWTELQKSGLKHAGVFAAYYFQNWQTWFAPKASDDDEKSFTITVPMGGKAWTGLDITELGAFVVKLFNNSDKYNGKIVEAYNGVYTLKQVAETFAKVKGNKYNAYEPSRDEFAGYGFPGADELADMFLFYQKLADVRDKNAKNAYSPLLKDEDVIITEDFLDIKSLNTLEDFIKANF
eukprot:TRINITY_DN67162_c5_g3_i1.p1 TRINITY_DN67162_c5_g3~~TRINITY_DN67162_c5_g3_i1.p1  ORF type:complete len:411 (-),score=193.36 TRINITY_DN67162_c5_g3_i1:49-1281(-)